jgi:NADPH:quinone reductase-like Zn-dependent oxidoreductase
VQITRFGGPEVLEIVDVPRPHRGRGRKLYEVSTTGVNYADTHHRVSVI